MSRQRNHCADDQLRWLESPWHYLFLLVPEAGNEAKPLATAQNRRATQQEMQPKDAFQVLSS